MVTLEKGTGEEARPFLFLIQSAVAAFGRVGKHRGPRRGSRTGVVVARHRLDRPV